MSRYVALSNYIDIPLLNVDKGNNLGEYKYDWYVELEDPSNLYPYLYIYLRDDDHPSIVGIITSFNMVNENLLQMSRGYRE